ncbi:hypothetical protein V6N13_136903 [Hibiscus sabdariffa]|uniref:Uncharacterized protein n=1 Tax=Hibiscus sabdariffa TaxID=183260 RepID=A0ABR2DM76_9ROSI
MSGTEDLNLLQGRIKKAKKEVRKWKASTEQMRNLVENHYQAVVQDREAVHQLSLAAEALDAQLLQFISAWLDKTDGH